MDRRDRRVAARTTATAPPAAPGRAAEPRHAQTHSGADADAEQAAAAAAAADSAPEDGDTPLAKVIPLGIFDPFAEADKRW